MKEINGHTYYSKKEMAEIFGCTIATINMRVLALDIQGIYLGRTKYYTADEMQRIAEYRRPKKESK